MGFAAGFNAGLRGGEAFHEAREKKRKREFMNQLGETGKKYFAPSGADAQPAVQPPAGLGDTPPAQPTTRSQKSGGYTDVAGGMTGASEPNTRFKTKEYVDGKMVTLNDSFRAYSDPAESARDWLGLMGNKRYSGVRNAQTLDEAIAAQGKSGYATDPQYAEKLRNMAPKTDAQRQFAEARRQELLAAGAPEPLAELGWRQAALETGWGRSAPNNNYFGIKGRGRDRSGRAVDPRTASTTGNGPAVSPHTLPDRAGGLGQAPGSADPRYQRFMQQSDPNKLAQGYQEMLSVAMANPEYMAEAAPVLQAAQQVGMAKWMQSFDGDPLSLDAWRHYGAGAAAFGVVVSPDKGISLQFQANQDARADRGEDRADRADDRAERSLRHSITQDELRTDRDERRFGLEQQRFGLSQNADARQERQLGLAENTDQRQEGVAQRQQEKHETEMSAKEREAQQEKLKLNRQIVTTMDEFLQDGELSPQEQQILERNFGVKATGNTRKNRMFNPGAGQAQEVTEYEVKMPDGSVVWASKEMAAAEAAALKKVAELDKTNEANLQLKDVVTGQDEWGEDTKKTVLFNPKTGATRDYAPSGSQPAGLGGGATTTPQPPADTPSRPSRGLSDPKVGIVDEAGNVIYANGERFMFKGVEHVVTKGKPVPVESVRY